MRPYIFRTFLCLLLALNIISTGFAQSEKSDALFAQGVEMYRNGKYKNAEKLFRECWELDSIELPSTNFRQGYSKDWLAASLWHQGNEKGARLYAPLAFDVEPTDRRLSTEADRHLQEGLDANSPQLFEIKIKFAISEAERTFGEMHPSVGSLNAFLATFYLSWDDLRNALKHISIAENIFNSLNSKSTFVPAMTALIKGKSELADGHPDKAFEYASQAKNYFHGLMLDCPFQYAYFLNLYSESAFAANHDADAISIINENWKQFADAPKNRRDNCFDIISAILTLQLKIDISDEAKIDNMFDEYYRIADTFDEATRLNIQNGYASVLVRHTEVLLQRSRFEEALSKINEAEKIVKATSLSDTETADLLFAKGNTLMALNHPDQALIYFQRASDGYKAGSKDLLSYFLQSEFQVANAYIAVGNETKGLEILENIPAEMALCQDMRPIDYAYIYHAISSSLSRQGHKEKSFNYLLMAFDEYQKCNDEKDAADYALIIRAMLDMGDTSHDFTALIAELESLSQKYEGILKINLNGIILNCKSLLAARAADLPTAINFAQESVDSYLLNGLPVPSDFSEYLKSLYDQSGNLELAFKAAMHRVESLEEVNNNHSLFYISALIEAAGTAAACLDLEAIHQLLPKAISTLQFCKDNIGIDDYNHSLLTIAECYTNISDFESAGKMLADSEKTFDNCSDRIKCRWLNVKMKIASGEDDSESASKLATQLLSMVNKLYSDHSDAEYSTYMANIAYAYFISGDLSTANNIFASILPSSPPSDPSLIPMSTAGQLTNYISILNSLGETEKASEWSKFVANYVGTLADENQIVGSIFSFNTTIADIYNTEGEDAVIKYVDNLVAQIENKRGTVSKITSCVKGWQLQVLTGLNRIEEALQIGKDHLLTLENAGVTPAGYFLFDYAEAAKAAMKNELAMDLLDKISGQKIFLKRQEKILLAVRYGDIHYLLGNMDKSFESYNYAFDLGHQFILNNFLTMSSRERSNFWNNNVDFFRTTLPLAAIHSGFRPDFTSLAYNASLFSTSLLLASDITVDEVVKYSADTKVKSAYSKFKRLKANLERLENSISDSSGTPLDKVQNETEAAEKELLQLLSQQLGHYNSRLNINWKDVQKNLHENEAAMEFILMQNPDNSQSYFALTLKKGDNAPQMHFLFVDSAENSIFKNCYKDSSLSDALVLALANRFAGCERIWFAPQGKFTATALESLPGLERISGLESTQYCRLTSTRELALSPESAQSKGNAIIYGGINYSTDAESLIKDADNYKIVKSDKGISRDFDSSLLFSSEEDERAIGRRRIPYLEGTLIEADFLESLLQNKKLARPLKPNILRAEAGTEASFKAMSGNSPTLLHVGTHGFYLSADNKSSRSFLNRYSNADSSEDDAMLRSGLLFAGADATLYGKQELPDHVDDGVLTAKEIASLNLSGTELTVLSACETALGDLNADGVFGLQRGFKKAGAGALLMTLWKVNDRATTLLMKEFYTNWLSKGMNKYEALESAKSHLKYSPEWNDPKYWAPFILLDAN